MNRAQRLRQPSGRHDSLAFTVPALDPKLVEALDALYPDRMPELDADIRFLAGQVDVVRFLKNVLLAQSQPDGDPSQSLDLS